MKTETRLLLMFPTKKLIWIFLPKKGITFSPHPQNVFDNFTTPITLKEGIHSCTKHLLSNFMWYSALSSSFVSALSFFVCLWYLIVFQTLSSNQGSKSRDRPLPILIWSNLGSGNPLMDRSISGQIGPGWSQSDLALDHWDQSIFRTMLLTVMKGCHEKRDEGSWQELYLGKSLDKRTHTKSINKGVLPMFWYTSKSSLFSVFLYKTSLCFS